MKVAIIGASKNPERTSHLALQRLAAAGHEVFPVNPKEDDILGHKAYPDITSVPVSIHTMTLYVKAPISEKLTGEILACKPNRIIFNPGAENDSLRDKAQAEGIKTEYACTLVLLSTNAF